MFCLPLPLNVIAAYLKSGEVGSLCCALQGDPALPVDVHDEGVRVRGEVASVLKLNLLQWYTCLCVCVVHSSIELIGLLW